MGSQVELLESRKMLSGNPVLSPELSDENTVIPPSGTASQQQVVENALDLIRATPLPNGAIRVLNEGESAGSAAGVRQYFADFGAQALLTTGLQSDREIVADWLGWLADNQEPEGIWYDRSGFLDSNGEIDPAPGFDRETIDAWDSSAAQYAVTLDRFQEQGGAVTEGMLVALRRSFDALKTLNKRAGFGVTIAKPSFTAEYLIDNVEVYAGLRSMENIFRRPTTAAVGTFSANELGQWAAQAASQARELSVGMDLYWEAEYFNSDGVRDQYSDEFSWARFQADQLFNRPDGAQFPDATANLAGVAWIRPELAAFNNVLSDYPEPESTPSAATGVERYYLAARRLDPNHTGIAAFWRQKLIDEASGFNSQTFVQRLGLTVLALEEGPDYFPNLLRRDDGAAMIVDNGEAGYNEFGGGWTDSGLRGGYGSGSRYSAQSGAGATWRPQNLAAGWYTVEFRNVADSANTTSARVTIKHAGSVKTRTFDQSQSNGFFSLGTYYFDGRGEEAVTIANIGSGLLRTDIVQFRAAPAPADTVIDNGQAGYSEFGGGWSNSGLTGSNSSGTRFTSRVGAGATWRLPTNLAAGWYSLDLYNVKHPSNTTDVKVTIKAAGRTTAQAFDPRASADGFFSLGTFYLDGSGSEAVTIQGRASGILRADALRIRATPLPGPVVVDNGDPQYSEFGEGWSNSGLTGQGGSRTRFTTTTGAGATWRPRNLVAGWYRVQVYNVQHRSNTTDARVTIKHNGTTVTRSLNQRTTATDYFTIDTFFFDGKGSEAVTIQNLGGVLRADAVRFLAAAGPGSGPVGAPDVAPVTAGDERAVATAGEGGARRFFETVPAGRVLKEEEQREGESALEIEPSGWDQSNGKKEVQSQRGSEGSAEGLSVGGRSFIVLPLVDPVLFDDEILDGVLGEF